MKAGQRLGPYEIVSALGAGGMGEVYRARDTKLNRDVAIKVLLPAVANDPDRLARFSREAQVLASLNHPNIAAIYGLEEIPADVVSGFSRTTALVMELVEGEDLSQRIARGSSPIDEALPIARQIAEALEAAHDHGIIHRDLKPANIKLRPDGTVKVLDFGLAKQGSGIGDQASGNAANSPTLSIHATQAGVILGTAAYMSPEQARGKLVDKRTDIWAFGCVLYEMLTGAPAFAGETTTDVLGAVVRADPDWSVLPSGIPSNVTGTIRRCLIKDAKQRLRDIGDVRQELERPPEPPRALIAAEVRSRGRKWVVPGIASLAAVLAVGALWWQDGRSHAIEWSTAVVGGPQITYFPKLSPDKKTLAFIAIIEGQSQVGILNPVTGDWSLLTRDRNRGAVVHIAWSTDGSRIYFDRATASGGDVWSVPALGGEPRLVVENGLGPEPLPDGSLLLARANRNGRRQLHRYFSKDGTLAPLPLLLIHDFVISYRAFPDGDEAIVFGYGIDDSATAAPQLYVVATGTGAVRLLAPSLRNLDPQNAGIPPLGVSADGRFVLTTRPGVSGSLLKVPREGGQPRVLFTTTPARISSVAEDDDGQLYVDQVDRATERLRISPLTGAVESLSAGLASGSALVLPDGRTVYSERSGTRFRLVASRPHQERVSFSDIEDDPRPPFALLNDREFALVSGSSDQPVVTVASTSDGRLIRRLDATRGKAVSGLAVSADQSTVYFGHGDDLWSLPVSGGEPQRFVKGTRIAFDPEGRFSLIQRPTADGIRLVTRDAAGRETTVPLPAGFELVGTSVWPGALRADGRLAVVVASPASWFWMPAVLNLRTGALATVPVQYAGDVQTSVSWQGEQILASALRIESKLWRFTPGTPQ
jgi:hypothetical protein